MAASGTAVPIMGLPPVITVTGGGRSLIGTWNVIGAPILSWPAGVGRSSASGNMSRRLQRLIESRGCFASWAVATAQRQSVDWPLPREAIGHTADTEGQACLLIVMAGPADLAAGLGVWMVGLV